MMQKWPADKVKRIPLAKLVPYARNARTHTEEQVAQIAASMREWGVTLPILVDEAGMIIAGHARVLAATKLGYDSLPCVTAIGWTDAQKRAYVIADNKLSLNSDWDTALLSIELADLADLGFDGALTGFSAAELAKLTTGRDDEAPEEFGGYDETIEVEHECPRCGYRWSGGRTTAAEPDEAGDEEAA